MINWIKVIENNPTNILSFLENKTPLELVSDQVLKAKLVKIIWELVKVGRSENISFPDNFINYAVGKASYQNDKVAFNDNDVIEIKLIIDIADKNKINVTNTKSLIELITNNG